MNEKFDASWYANKYPDVLISGINPLIHYQKFGKLINRKGAGATSASLDEQKASADSPPDGLNLLFDEHAYTTIYNDVVNSSLTPLQHYRSIGQHENRVGNYLERFIEILFQTHARSSVSNLLHSLLSIDASRLPHEKRQSALRLFLSRLKKAIPPNSENTASSLPVSIIIPVYNQVFHTLACLISLFESAPHTHFDVIIADDCSTDETPNIFLDISERIRVVRTAENLGFLKNCNHAAKQAAGEFIVLLNNDMILLPNWLDSLFSTISKDNECGMVGSMLINLNGTLQEAGGIFWNDGSAWNYGRGQNPMEPEFNYKREVDYCSGASICLRTKVWVELGGFDEIYAPAYCEDSDLAFRLRARGLKVIYQPRSIGIHLEGVSCGRDTAHGIKAYQVENQKKLMLRWSEVLRKEHYESGTNIFNARGKTKTKKSILIVDHYIPQHDRDAGSRTMLHIIERFLENGYNIIFWPENLYFDTKYAHYLQEMGVMVLYNHDFPTDFETWFKTNAKFLHGVFLSRPQVAHNVIKTVRTYSNLTVAFYGHDIHHLRLQRQASIDTSDSKAIIEAKLIEEVEKSIWDEADVVFYPSQNEVDYIKEQLISAVSIAKVRLLPPWSFRDFRCDVSANLEKRAGLLFVAGFAHPPNIEAALWFTKNVWPLVLTSYPSATLTLAGSNPAPEISALSSGSVKVTGYISESELEALYVSSRVSIAPLLHGAGVKGKVVEALRFGLPVVTTPTGVQGIPDPSNAITIAESPAEMAQSILKLLTENKLWLRHSAASLQLVTNLYSTDAMWEPLKDLF
jgi:GT2 family glycosyltransferase